MKFLNNIDLQKNEIQNFRVQNLAAAPSNPVAGQHYFNTVDNTEYVFNGTEWINALSQGNYVFEGGVQEVDRKVSLTPADNTNIGGVIVGDNIDVTDGKISVKAADKTVKGLIQVATDEEAAAGIEDTKAVTAKQVKTGLDLKADKTALEATDAKVAENTAAIATKADKSALAETDAKVAQNTADIATNKAATEKNAADIVTANEEIAKKADKTALAATDEKVAANEAQIALNKAAHEANAKTIADNKTAVDEALALKADKTELPTALSDLTDDSATTPIAQANTLTGLTATVEELNFVDGVTSNIQEQLDAKLASADVPEAISDLTDDTDVTPVKQAQNLAGMTTTVAELNEIHDAGVVKADLEKLHAVEASATELNFVKGVTASVQEQLDSKVAKNADIEAAQKCKITYDAKGLVVAGADLEATDIPDLSATYINVNQKGVANGVATLDANGLVPAAQLPSYVDDVIDLAKVGADAPAAAEGAKYFNTTDNKVYTYTDGQWVAADAEADKIYVNLENNMAYRWSGTTLVQIGADKLLGFNGQIVGDGATTEFTINHNLGTRNVVFEIYEATTPYEKVYVQVLHNSTTELKVVFSQAPEVGTDYNVTIIAIG